VAGVGARIEIRSTLPSKLFNRSRISARVWSFLTGCGSLYLQLSFIFWHRLHFGRCSSHFCFLKRQVSQAFNSNSQSWITSRDAAKKNKAYLCGNGTSLLPMLEMRPRISARCQTQIHNSSFVNNTICIASAIKAQEDNLLLLSRGRRLSRVSPLGDIMPRIQVTCI
jgi:hypothetical protein